MLHKGKCPFLSEKGCVLPEKLKPFDCKLFPLAFKYENKQIKFFLNKKCPFIDRIPKSWIRKTKKWALKELRNWNEEEKITYSKIIEKYPPSQLIPM